MPLVLPATQKKDAAAIRAKMTFCFPYFLPTLTGFKNPLGFSIAQLF